MIHVPYKCPVFWSLVSVQCGEPLDKIACRMFNSADEHRTHVEAALFDKNVGLQLNSLALFDKQHCYQY